MNDLVARLTKPQEIAVSFRPEPTTRRLAEALERGYVLLRFLATDTELGVRLDRSRCDVRGADFAAGHGLLRLVGELVLDYTRVRCHADIDLARLAGTGRLEVLAQTTPAELAQIRSAR